MAVLSYAQNFEDVLLARVFPGDGGFYIDVGAADPVNHSVTKLFYARGWRGVNVEPVENFFRRLQADRPDDVNLHAALGAAPGPAVIYEVPDCAGWATLVPEQAAKLRADGRAVVERPVQVLTLTQVCERYVRGDIDFLKIDVEGGERDVLLGADLRRWRPRVLVLEATEQGSPTPNHAAWEPLVLDSDYLFAQFDGLNRYYVRAEDRDLLPALQVPVCCFDDAVPYPLADRIRQLEADLGAAARERDSARDELAAAAAGLDAAHRDADELRQGLSSAQAEREVATTAVAAAAAARDAAHRRAADLAAELAQLTDLLAAARGRAEAAERLAADRDRLAGEVERLRRTTVDRQLFLAQRAFHETTREHLLALQEAVLTGRA